VLEALLSMNRGGVRRVRLVVNSRMELGGGLWGADQILLAALPAADAQELLRMHGGREVRWEEGQALQLVEMCGCNALALTLVGGLLAARRCTPEVRCYPCHHVLRLCIAQRCERPHAHALHCGCRAARNIGMWLCCTSLTNAHTTFFLLRHSVAPVHGTTRGLQATGAT
jgi:hypothetical protein